MNKKIFLTLCLSFVFILSLAAFAAGETVYVKDGGTGDGSSASAPVGTLSAAAEALDGKGGTITLVGDTTLSAKLTIPEQSGDLTITSENGAKLVLAAMLYFEKNANDNTVTLDMPLKVSGNTSRYIFGGFNSIVLSENFSVDKSAGEKAGLNFLGGVNCLDAADVMAATTTLPYSITVNAGDFNLFGGGNFRTDPEQVLGSIAAPVTVTINGGTFGASGTYDVMNPNKTYIGTNVSGMSILASDVTLSISGGTFNSPIFVQGRRGTVKSKASKISAEIGKDKDLYAVDGDVKINITGGTFNSGIVAAYTEVGYNQLLRGDYTVNIAKGATFTDGVIIDATQVKAYAGSDKKATLVYDESYTNLDIKRFDVVNGAVQEVTEPLRVTFIGDSITEGASASNRMTQSYSAIFLETARAAGKDVIVTNLGASSAGMLPSTFDRYYPTLLAYPIALYETDADYFVFALGTNDANSVGGSNGAQNEYYTRYKAFVKACGDAVTTEKVFVTSALIRTNDNANDNRASALVRPLQKQIATELAANEPDKYVFVDTYALLFDEAAAGTLLSTSDYLHPTTEGHAEMGQAMYDAIFGGVCTVENFEMSDVYVSASGSRYGAGTPDDPTSSLAVAFSKAAKNATIHIVGEFSVPYPINTPIGLDMLTVTGEGSGAVLTLTYADDVPFKINSSFKLDNITLKKEKNAIVIAGNYNNVEITDSVSFDGNVDFCAGSTVQGLLTEESVVANGYYDSVETVSSNNDCTVTINGGVYRNLMFGNRRYYGASPFGTYSGDMTVNIGAGVTVASNTYSGISGMNYLTGTIIANIASWGDITLATFARAGSLGSAVEFAPENNSGEVVVNIIGDANITVARAFDINMDGSVNIRDALAAIKSSLNGTTDAEKLCYFGYTIKLIDVLGILKLLVK